MGEWTLSPLKCLPKFSGAQKTSDMRALALQNICMKCITTAIMIRPVDAFLQIIPLSQKGFVAGRQMMDHLLYARPGWERLPDHIMVAVDFQKAYDSLSFAMLRLSLLYIGVPAAYVTQMMSVVSGLMLFCVPRGFVPDVEPKPQFGIRHGGSLSLLLFDVITILIYNLNS